MKLLKSLETVPSKKSLIILSIASLVLLFVVTPIMQYFSDLSGNPTSIISRQFSLDPSVLRSDYQYMLTYGNINAFKITTFLDFGFMTCYGILGFSSSLLLARKIEKETIWSKAGYVMTITGPVAAVLDAIENTFILLTLTDPLNFPNWWAYIHFIAAIPKWILLFALIGWAFIALVYLLLMKVKSKKE